MSQLPLLIAALALAEGCTFGPPGTVPNNTGPQPDAGNTTPSPDAYVGESLIFTYTSQPVGQDSRWAPANVLATWIEDAAGMHVATIDRKSTVRTSSLIAWLAASGANNTDAVSGASRLNHDQPVVVDWQIPAALPNGIYTIRVETSDANVTTAAENTHGSFSFEKNGIASIQMGAAVDILGYTNVIIDYSGAIVRP